MVVHHPIYHFEEDAKLFIKDMDEQDGAPGDMFKGPIFSYAMIVIGTLVLVATIYTILVETCEVNPEEAARAASKRLARPAAQVAPPDPLPSLPASNCCGIDSKWCVTYPVILTTGIAVAVAR